MGIRDLQDYLESVSLEGGSVSVDLLKIARNVTQRQQPHNTNRKIRPIGNKLKLIIDAENCLDRLYGGYFSDWACGGQWNRMVQFLSLLTRAIERGNIELAVVFNGTIEQCRMNEWIQEQANIRQHVGMVLKHVNTKATPPPKIWWTPPTCLRSALRMAMRHLGVTVMCTMDDHHQEVIAYCREYGFHGLLADDGEYAAFDPPRYFSSENLKLTYKGSLETKEYMINELTKSLQITQEQLCIMAALLGNFLLPESELQDFYKRIGFTNSTRDNKSPSESNMKVLSDYVRTLPPPSNMDSLVSTVFGSIDDKRTSRLRQSIQYYLNGTASGFLKYCAPPSNPRDKKVSVQNNNVTSSKQDDDLGLAGFASETSEQQEETLQNYKLATVNLVMSSEYNLESNGTFINSHNDTSQFNGINGTITVQSNQLASTSSSASSNTSTTNKVNLFVSSSSSNTSSVPSSPKHNLLQNLRFNGNFVIPIVSPDVLRTASLRHQKGLMAPMILHVLSTQEVRLPCLMEDESNRELPPIHDIYQLLRQRIYAVLFNLHHLRYVYLKKKECNSENNNNHSNSNNNNNGEHLSPPDIVIKEWIYSKSNPYQYGEMVKAEPLPWAVPTLQRLWFGPAVDDKRRRMRALLSCLNSDTPLILNTSYVPQHMLIMACVLRYIMSQDKPIMRRHELDAFLCQAFNVDLMNPQYLQELTLNVVTSRGVQLAALFMQGVEMALVANDACGAPLPWLMCCPWLYFDGKLFHYTLNRSSHSKNILEVCESHIERVVKVERMRKAILEGLDVKFAKLPLPPFTAAAGILPRNNGGNYHHHHPPPASGIPTLPQPNITNRIPNGGGSGGGGGGGGGGGIRQRPIQSRGGQLQVAGVVVGSWGANYGYQNQNMRQQNHLISGGGGSGGGNGNGSGSFHNGRGRILNNGGNQHMTSQYFVGKGRGQPQQQQQQQQRKINGPSTFHLNRRYNYNNSNNGNKRRNNTNKLNKSQPTQHTLTVKTEIGDIPADDIIIKEDGIVLISGKTEDCNNKSVCSTNEQHKGQGDSPAALITNTQAN